MTEARGRRDVLNAPFRKLAGDLSSHVKNVDYIIANDYWLAGNLVLWFPGKPVDSLDLNPPRGSFGPALLVWDASRRTQAPKALAGLATNSLSQPQFFEEKWKFHRSGTMRLGVMHVAAGATE